MKNVGRAKRAAGRFGQRAPVDAVDAAIAAAVARVDAASRRMAAGDLAALPELIAAEQARIEKIVERDTIIRNFFYKEG